MPPKKGSASSKEADALAVEEQRQAKRSREIFDAAVDGRQLSRVRPSSIRELVPSKLLRRSDCKDIHKRSSVKKSRYMTIFPGQLAHLKEGRIGSLAKLREHLLDLRARGADRGGIGRRERELLLHGTSVGVVVVGARARGSGGVVLAASSGGGEYMISILARQAPLRGLKNQWLSARVARGADSSVASRGQSLDLRTREAGQSAQIRARACSH